MITEAQYLTIGLGDEVFAVPVANVREVLDLCPVTHMPHAPDYLRGVIDLRGKGVPVLDLRAKLGLTPVQETPHTRIIVIDVELAGRPLLIGALADRVFEVTALDGQTAEPPPDIGTRWQSECIRGIGRRGERFVIILDLAVVFSSEESLLAA